MSFQGWNDPDGRTGWIDHRPARPERPRRPQRAPWETETAVWDSAPAPAEQDWDFWDPRAAESPGPESPGIEQQLAPERSVSREDRHSRGLLPGALVGFLAAAVALGVANLVAAFVRPQASPIIAVGEAFIDRTPPAVKNFAVQKFGENDKNMLLLGMYVTIALLAVVIGILAWRRIAIGVAGIGLFGLFGAFVALTRPESHFTDVIPSIVGGAAGIAAIVWLVRAGAPVIRYQPRRARGTRRAGGMA